MTLLTSNNHARPVSQTRTSRSSTCIIVWSWLVWATGGLLTTAFLQVAVPADVIADGADAFTIGGYTFDPFTSPGVEGWDPVSPSAPRHRS